MNATEGNARRKLSHLFAATALMLAVGAGGAQAQGGPTLPRQGFEATSQDPSKYTPQEAEAVAVALRWIETTNKYDTRSHMALLDDNVAFRADPLDPLRRGAGGYCTAFNFIESKVWFGLNELYVVGGPSDTLVLMNRTDIKGPHDGTLLSGYPVPLAGLLRVRNGRIVEWYDMPTNKVSVGALPGGPSLVRREQPIPERCRSIAERVVGTTAAASGGAKLEPARTYGTSKPQFWFNPYEQSAAQSVRAWYAARQAGNPLLLGAFVDLNVSFRLNPADDLGKGRDNLLKSICGYIGGRLELTDLFVVGGDYDTAVITRWNTYDANGNRTPMGSFFRVRNGLIVEWMDSAVAGASTARSAGQNSTACQTVNAALAPRPAASTRAGGPPPGGPAP